jgi:HTH-type transcriptional regulator/antitoxin HigA
LELLSIFVNEYETRTFDIPKSDPIDIIRFIMEQREMKQADLIGILGDKTNVSKVLNRKRPLTLEMIRKFSKAFNVSADLLIKEYSLAC